MKSDKKKRDRPRTRPDPYPVRSDGLTSDEGLAMDALHRALGAFAILPRQHPDELRDYMDGIRRCRDQLAMRVARRQFPDGWPPKKPKDTL